MIVRRLRLRPGFPRTQPQVTNRMEAAALGFPEFIGAH
jgi:hypothetical protein